MKLRMTCSFLSLITSVNRYTKKGIMQGKSNPHQYGPNPKISPELSDETDFSERTATADICRAKICNDNLEKIPDELRSSEESNSIPP